MKKFYLAALTAAALLLGADSAQACKLFNRFSQRNNPCAPQAAPPCPQSVPQPMAAPCAQGVVNATFAPVHYAPAPVRGVFFRAFNQQPSCATGNCATSNCPK